MIRLNLDSNIFNPIYLDKRANNQHVTQLYYGGSSSGKSYALAQFCILDVLNGRNYLVVRNTKDTLRKTTFNELCKAVSNFKLTRYFIINQTNMTITCKLNQSQILFSGLDNPEKIKSITPKKGVITDVWIEEATEVAYTAYKQLKKRLRGQTKHIKRVFLSFNPVSQSHWIYKEFFSIWQDDKQYVESDKVSILKTTYKDNKFLTFDDIEELESDTDEFYYNVYTLGNWGILGDLIFKNWKVEDFDKDNFSNYCNGVDWGFSQDPFSLARVAYERDTIYICEDFQAKGLSNYNAYQNIKDIVSREPVVCDSAEPKSVAEFREYGINAMSCKKGKGSIEHGIRWIRSKRIVVHPSCQNARNELEMYQFKKDKEGNSLTTPVDRDNHFIDAMRYALENEMINRKVEGFKERW